jgi:hypothetical protein
MKEALKKLAQSETLIDEKGKKSFFRTWLSIWIINIIVSTWADLVGLVTLESVHVAIWGVGITLLAAGAGVPRAMQHLGPQLGKATDSLSKIKRDKRLPNPLEDDERG